MERFLRLPDKKERMLSENRSHRAHCFQHIHKGTIIGTNLMRDLFPKKYDDL